MKSILIAMLLLPSQVLFASGTTIGNGGNSVVCKNSSGNISSVEMLDFYEARLNGGTLKLNSQLSNYKDILTENLERWRNIAPYRVTQYLRWLSEFENESLITTGEIPQIPDTGSIILPEGCELKPIAFQRPESENLPGVKRYTIRKDLWNRLDEVQKAGLVMHELIYREGIKVGHKTSFPTRYFNGYLATAEPDAKTYAYIVRKLPFEWVELGGMLLQFTLVESDYGSTKCQGILQLNGDLDACFKNTYGPIVTDRFSISELSFYSEHRALFQIVSSKEKFLLHSIGPWHVKNIRVTSHNYNLDFNINYVGRRELLHKFLVDPNNSQGFAWFRIDIVGGAKDFVVKMENPAK